MVSYTLRESFIQERTKNRMTTHQVRQLKPGNLLKFKIEHFNGFVVVVDYENGDVDELLIKYTKWACSAKARFTDLQQTFVSDADSDHFQFAERVA